MRQTLMRQTFMRQTFMRQTFMRQTKGAPVEAITTYGCRARHAP
jgi:hypothetical protein